ncbi:hypothetical protein QBC47DRAFT_305426 [Echria macrotheca]|uniref:Uncharacterized protein n=1 Tax=Echria macrotheca TaxID=438768 RepID=A0AAJ0F8S5_9PEZI|nr:hypothetical protein QBC47DRAFT_305426 [Echria macrotheca]
MTPHASHCCRTLQRQISSTRDSLWISDSLLAAAFDRYCLVSRNWNRAVSYVPGPLESRRRLGKRQLGDLTSLQHSSAPPAWAFSAPIDLSQWQWEAPQSPLALQKNRETREDVLALSSALPRWLRALATDVPSEQTPPLTDLVRPEPSWRDRISFRPDLDSFLFSVDNTPVDLLLSNTQNLCFKLQQSIFLGEILPSDIQSISAEIWDALDSRFANHVDGRTAYFALYSAIVTGINTSSVLRPQSFKFTFWNTLLLRVSNLPPDDGVCELFSQIMSATRHVSRAGMDEGILAVLSSVFSHWGSHDAVVDTAEVSRLLDTLASASTILSADLRHAQMISKALSTVGPGKFGRLLHAANRLVLERACVSATRLCELRYNWLSVLAQIPLVKQETLFKTAEILAPGFVGAEPLSGTELCSLMMSQWTSRGYLRSQDSLRRKFEEYSLGCNDMAIAALALAICRSSASREHRKAMYTSLWQLLARLDRSYDMIKSLRALSRTRQVPRYLLQALSAASCDHHVALHLQMLYSRQLRRNGGPDWDPVLVGRHMDKIVSDPSLPSGTVWTALGINRPGGEDEARGNPPTKLRHRGAYGTRRAAIVQRLATVLSDAPHLRNRVAFRQVSQCVRFLEQATGKVPVPTIRALYRVVSRDLVEMRPGRTTRLRWFLNVVERNYGMEVARRCRHELKGWRHKLRRLWVWRGGERGSEQQQ